MFWGRVNTAFVGEKEVEVTELIKAIGNPFIQGTMRAAVGKVNSIWPDSIQWAATAAWKKIAIVRI